MRLICAGTPAFATHIFSHLSKEHEILALICQPDKPFGRKGELKPPHTKESLGHIGMPILQPSHIDEPFIAHIRALKPDMIIVVAYGQILPTAFLKIAPCINIHASILPKWRGASPLQQMIMSKEPYFGISAMLMNERLDSGKILGLSYIENTQQDINKLSLELASLGAKLALYVIAHFQSIEPIKQIDADASYCTKIKKSDGYIEFDCASKIYSAYLAYCTWPHIFIKSTHGYTLKLFDVSLIESSSSHEAGEILQIESPYIIVGCTQGSLRIGALQQEGKNKLEATTYLRGKHLKMGDILC